MRKSSIIQICVGVGFLYGFVPPVLERLGNWPFALGGATVFGLIGLAVGGMISWFFGHEDDFDPPE